MSKKKRQKIEALCDKVIAAKWISKRLTDVEIKGRLRARTLHFVNSANERRRVLDIARVDELDVTTREQSGGGFAVIYMPNARKL